MKSLKLVCIGVSLVLVGCGGSDSSSDTSDVLTGVFIDSAVQGISYSTETQSGVTNNQGEFNHKTGETVTFSIGTLLFPQISAAPIVTPADMSDTGEYDSDVVINVAKLLQTLDVDGDLDNGIQISEQAAASATEIDFSVGQSDFESDANVINLVANSGSVNTALRSKEQVIEHLEDSLLNPITTQDDLAEYFGTRLYLNENYLVLRNDGTFDGVWEGEPLAATWEFREGYFCRVLTQFHNENAIGSEGCQLWREEITGKRIRGTQDRGEGVSFWYTKGNDSPASLNNSEALAVLLERVLHGLPVYEDERFMINLKPYAISLLLITVVSGCVLPSSSPKRRGVTVGMTMEEVEDLIGPPKRTSSFSSPEGAKNCPVVWKYDGYNVTFFGDTVTATQ